MGTAVAGKRLARRAVFGAAAVLAVAVALAASGCGGKTTNKGGSGDAQTAAFTDSRDGKTYKTVKIGKQTWMAENMNYMTEESKCYADKDANCEKYGRLYKWKDAMHACPVGWRLPTAAEWDTLITAVGGVQEPEGEDGYFWAGDVGKKLKARSGWKGKGNGTDAFGFSALPGGFGGYPEGDGFSDVGKLASWWTATAWERSASGVSMDLSRSIYTFSIEFITDNGNAMYSARCVQIEKPVTATFEDKRDGKIYRTVKIGEQNIMAENLNYKTDDSKCYENDDANCEKYGRLYTWDDAVEACPAGWHLTTDEEWEALTTAVGGVKERHSDAIGDFRWETAGRKLKSKTGWNDFDDGQNGNGTDEYGFAALPGGFGGPGDDDEYRFFDAGGYASWWTGTEYDVRDAWIRKISNSLDYNTANMRGEYVRRGGFNNKKDYMFSARCTEGVQGAAWSFVDERDYAIYKTVQIGEQRWMAENLKYETPKSLCYGNDSANCGILGRYYNWYEARGACPAGWHLPSDEEWTALTDYMGGAETAGEKLKSRTEWFEGRNGTDDYGFAARPGGSGYSDGRFHGFSLSGFWWTSTASSGPSVNALGRYMDDLGANVRRNDVHAANYFNARCLQNTKPATGVFTDRRDEKAYKTVKIGKQTWMAENLNYKTDSSVCYENNEANCQNYGRLYTWNDALNACPAGWHLPTNDEWTALTDAAGGGETAGTRLKAASGWNSRDGVPAGTDDYGFSALPGGSGDGEGEFKMAGSNGAWWSATENGAPFVWTRMIYHVSEKVSPLRGFMTDQRSARCVQD